MKSTMKIYFGLDMSTKVHGSSFIQVLLETQVKHDFLCRSSTRSPNFLNI